MESQGGSGPTEGGGGDGQSGQAASTALIEKILSEEPRWQGTSLFQQCTQWLPLTHVSSLYGNSHKTIAPVFIGFN